MMLPLGLPLCMLPGVRQRLRPGRMWEMPGPVPVDVILLVPLLSRWVFSLMLLWCYNTWLVHRAA